MAQGQTGETAVRELRRDPVTGGWVIIASDLSREPGEFLRHPGSNGKCRLCPGEERSTPNELLAFRDSGGPNEPGWRVRVIPNFSPVLRVEGTLDPAADGPYDKMNGIGAHEILVESPVHDRGLADLTPDRVTDVLFALRERFVDLRRDGRLRYIAAFKNQGEAAGAAPHGHGQWQIVGLPVVPKRVLAEAANGLRHYAAHDRCVVCDLLQQEVAGARRIIAADNHFVVIAPYASRVPFETWIVPRVHGSHFENAPQHVLESAAGALRATLRRMNAALEEPAYNITLQSAPIQEGSLAHYHWRIEIVPRITRDAGSGFEWGTDAHVNPTAPEEAAQFLREALID